MQLYINLYLILKQGPFLPLFFVRPDKWVPLVSLCLCLPRFPSVACLVGPFLPVPTLPTRAPAPPPSEMEGRRRRVGLVASHRGGGKGAPAAGSPAPPLAALRLSRRDKLGPVVLRTPNDSGERIHMRTARASTSSGAKIHLEVLETAAMTSPPWCPPVRRGLLAGGAHGGNCPIQLGEVGLVGNVVPVAEARSLLRASAHQPPEPQLAPPASGRRSPQLTAPCVGPSKTALASTRSLPRPVPLDCRSLQLAPLRRLSKLQARAASFARS
jgi:hypothetical protein